MCTLIALDIEILINKISVDFCPTIKVEKYIHVQYILYINNYIYVIGSIIINIKMCIIYSIVISDYIVIITIIIILFI